MNAPYWRAAFMRLGVSVRAVAPLVLCLAVRTSSSLASLHVQMPSCPDTLSGYEKNKVRCTSQGGACKGSGILSTARFLIAPFLSPYISSSEGGVMPRAPKDYAYTAAARRTSKIKTFQAQDFTT